MSRELPALDPETYAHLRALAGRIHAERGRRQDTMQPTALLHEAWMKVATSSSKYNDREHFMAVAARAMLDLDDALEQLEQVDADVAQVAVLRTFGGMTAPEAAAALNTSVRTLQRQWRFARVFLAQPLGGGVSSDDRSPQGGRPTPAGVPRSSVTRYGTNPR